MRAALRDGASVWVLEQHGYAEERKGSNAFACLVSRRAGDLFPVCFDAEGARSLLPVDVDDAQLRLSGKSSAQIEAIIAERYQSGQYHAPPRAGVAYMLSPMRYRIDEHGAVARTPSTPHLMFYGPNLTDGDIGGARGAFVFMNRVGSDGTGRTEGARGDRQRNPDAGGAGRTVDRSAIFTVA